MANVKTTNIGIEDSIHLYLQHWKYWHNYEDTTVLTDPQWNIIAFFDRKTENIDVIMADLPHPWGFIIANWYWFEIKELIKYKPYDYEMARFKYNERVKKYKIEKKSIDWLWGEMLKEFKEYNINYFENVKMDVVANSSSAPVYAFEL